MSARNDIIEAVSEFIRANKPDAPDFDSGTLLHEQRIIDSFVFVTLIVFLEEKFQIKLDNEDMNACNFKTIETIADLVTQKSALKA